MKLQPVGLMAQTGEIRNMQKVCRGKSKKLIVWNILQPPEYRLINYYCQLVGGGGISNLYCLL